MNLPTVATLVVLSATGTCSVDNIDISEPVSLAVPTLEQCKIQAEIIDKSRGVRAFCITEE